MFLNDSQLAKLLAIAVGVNPVNRLRCQFLILINKQWNYPIAHATAMKFIRNSSYTFSRYTFCEYVKFGTISWKFDIFGNQFSLPNFAFFLVQNHLALLKDRFLKKMLLVAFEHLFVRPPINSSDFPVMAIVR